MLEVIYLYVILHDDDSNGERFRTKMPSMEVCTQAVTNAKLSAPDTASGDFEAIAAMWCGGEFERNYNATWWKDEAK